ncbi:MAG: GDP-L-fucose synthase [Candidatus Omnitrophota bacterium]|jgi:GDP-L-fucose synthase
MFKKARIYIAGHGGLLGSALFALMRREGYRNILVRTRAELDLTKQSAVERFFRTEKPEYVFLCAGLTGGIIANKTNPAAFLHTNSAIQDNVFEFAFRQGVKCLVFYGSSCVYPRGLARPIREDDLLTGKIEETSEGYAVAKISGIIACKSYNVQYRRNTCIALVPNTMYGPFDSFDPAHAHVMAALIAKMHRAKTEKEKKVVLWGSGTPRREFVFSEDVARASMFAALHADTLGNRHYNVGTGRDYSIKELAGMIARITGFRGRIEWDSTKPDGTPRKLLNSSDFLRLGWKPCVGLEEGICKTYAWYVKHLQRNE